jgi:hypothetical protein
MSPVTWEPPTKAYFLKVPPPPNRATKHQPLYTWAFGNIQHPNCSRWDNQGMCLSWASVKISSGCQQCLTYQNHIFHSLLSWKSCFLTPLLVFPDIISQATCKWTHISGLLLGVFSLRQGVSLAHGEFRVLRTVPNKGWIWNICSISE